MPGMIPYLSRIAIYIQHSIHFVIRLYMEWALYMLELLGITVMYIGFIKSEDVIKRNKWKKWLI